MENTDVFHGAMQSHFSPKSKNTISGNHQENMVFISSHGARFFCKFQKLFFDVSPKKTVLHSATGKSSSLRRDDEKREQYQWTRTAQTRTAQQERKARMAHKERRTKREQHTTKGQQRRNQYTFFGASVDLARSMVGQLFSSCWRTGENAKDWMSSSNSKNSKHKKKAKTDTN